MASVPKLPIVLSLVFPVSASATEYSEAKIRRIIHVSAAYFDLNPWGEPFVDHLRAELRTPLSFLPALREKEFARDMPFLHGIPILSAAYPFGEALGLGWSTSTWYGTLIPGLERLVGVSASPRQWLLGTSISVAGRASLVAGWASMGLQTARTRVAGMKEPVDSRIETESLLQWFTLGLARGPFWSSFSCGLKDTVVDVAVAGGIELHEHDSLGDAPLPVWMNGTVGYDFEDWRLAVSEVWLPRRLMMPRLLLSRRLL